MNLLGLFGLTCAKISYLDQVPVCLSLDLEPSANTLTIDVEMRNFDKTTDATFLIGAIKYSNEKQITNVTVYSRSEHDFVEKTRRTQFKEKITTTFKLNAIFIDEGIFKNINHLLNIVDVHIPMIKLDKGERIEFCFFYKGTLVKYPVQFDMYDLQDPVDDSLLIEMIIGFCSYIYLLGIWSYLLVKHKKRA